MSTDYSVACQSCQKYTHLGQRMGGKYSFGFGSNDSKGREAVMKWISEHISHDCYSAGNICIMLTDEVPYAYVHVDLQE